jgi:hypothetical protein
VRHPVRGELFTLDQRTAEEMMDALHLSGELVDASSLYRLPGVRVARAHVRMRTSR